MPGVRCRDSSTLILYFDTSALIKLVAQEDGSELAAELTSTGYRNALADFEATHRELLVVAVDDSLARHAGELAEGLDLREYDAVHLASSLALGPNTTVISWDRDLNRAAHRSGLAVAPAP